MKLFRNITLLLVLTLSSTSFAQQLVPQGLREKVRTYRENNEHKIIKEYMELLSFPNRARDRADIRKVANHIVGYLKERGVDSRLIETAGNPIVYGELLNPNATQTIMFYVHYDGQPTDPKAWIDQDPFEPIIRPGKLDQSTGLPKGTSTLPPAGQKFNPDHRVYARSASDDKAPIIGIMTALDALKSSGLAPTSNVKFLFEGEEEAGSTNLKDFALENRELLKTDLLFMADGPLHFSNKPTLGFGVRGVTGLQVTTYGPNTSVHSGHYGNWAPNPGLRLVQLLNTMYDKNSSVIVDGFYDSVTPLTESEKQSISDLTKKDKEVMENYGLAAVYGGGKSLMEMLQLPSLTIKGMNSAWVGSEAKNIIPSSATANLGIRLVKGNDPEKMVEKVIKHIEKQGYHIVYDNDPDHKTRLKYPLIARINKGRNGYPAARTSMDTPIIQLAINTYKEFHNNDIELKLGSGGSLPLYIFTDLLKLPIVSIPIANFDNNQHQPNENIRIGHLWNGIESYAALLMLKNSELNK